MGTMLDAGYLYSGFHRHFPLLGGQAPEAKRRPGIIPLTMLHTITHYFEWFAVCRNEDQPRNVE
jgi:hypothetical protein